MINLVLIPLLVIIFLGVPNSYGHEIVHVIEDRYDPKCPIQYIGIVKVNTSKLNLLEKNFSNLPEELIGTYSGTYRHYEGHLSVLTIDADENIFIYYPVFADHLSDLPVKAKKLVEKLNEKKIKSSSRLYKE